jgi:succinate dehydrogenase / fumarate reductase flavoprotein subunit
VQITNQNFDIIIIGAGGAGLMAAISAIEEGVKKIAVISKVHPFSSHTVSAKGGINAALGNVLADDWKFHAFDTIKGSDYLADIDAVEALCINAQEAILDLEKRGVVFSRQQDGKLAQRAYGGQTLNYGNEVAYRACYSKDKTGHTILHTLYQQALKADVKFFDEVFVSDLLIKENACHGCLAINLNEGNLIIFSAAQTILATGGYSQIYQNTTSSTICSGDGSALVLKENLPLKDMEFVQFHPTGIAGYGFLITEAVRGEGAYLLNSMGDRFMQNYAPKMMELASRDVISQAISTEIYQGKGCGKNKDYLHLDLRHLSHEVLTQKLPGVVELVAKFLRLDVKKDLIPIAPSAHYTMGGVPCDVDCKVIDGLFAIGEVACASIHGANRLGCNSLLDLIVFGKIAGKKAAQNLENKQNLAKEIAQVKIKNLQKILEKNSNNCELSLSKIKENLQEINEKHLGVFRNQKLLELGFSKLKELYKIFKNYSLKEKSLLWNEELIQFLELEFLFLNSLAANFSALNRTESRGAHYRSDFLQRDDANFLAHSMVKILKNDQENFILDFSLQDVRKDTKFAELKINPQVRKY